MKAKLDYFCKLCGSNDIHHDAAVKYNKDTQDYEVVAVHEGMYCQQCRPDETDEHDITFGVFNPSSS